MAQEQTWQYVDDSGPQGGRRARVALREADRGGGRCAVLAIECCEDSGEFAITLEAAEPPDDRGRLVTVYKAGWWPGAQATWQAQPQPGPQRATYRLAENSVTGFLSFLFLDPDELTLRLPGRVLRFKPRGSYAAAARLPCLERVLAGTENPLSGRDLTRGGVGYGPDRRRASC